MNEIKSIRHFGVTLRSEVCDLLQNLASETDRPVSRILRSWVEAGIEKLIEKGEIKRENGKLVVVK